MLVNVDEPEDSELTPELEKAKLETSELAEDCTASLEEENVIADEAVVPDESPGVPDEDSGGASLDEDSGGGGTC